MSDEGIDAWGRFGLEPGTRELLFRLDPTFEARSATVLTDSDDEIPALLQELEPAGSGRWKVLLEEASGPADRMRITWISRMRDERGEGKRRTARPGDARDFWAKPRVWWGQRAWYPVWTEGPTTFSLEVSAPAQWPEDRAVLSVGPADLAKVDETSDASKRRWLFHSEHPIESLPLAVGTWRRSSVTFQGARLDVFFLAETKQRVASRVLRKLLAFVEENVKRNGPLAWKRLRVIEVSRAASGSGPSMIALDRAEFERAAGGDGDFQRRVLQQWWKHALYRDPAQGDWLPGLLTYLSDHQRAGAEPGGHRAFRRELLRRYALLVDPRAEPALEDLLPVDSAAGERSAAHRAILRSKGAMVFHMLHERLGEQNFAAVVRAVYSKYRHRRISWSTFQAVASQQLRQDLSWFFDQWVRRAGAPSLKVERAIVRGDEDDLRLQVGIDCGGAWRVNLPVLVLGDDRALEMRASAVRGRARLGMRVPTVPDRISVDPAHHVMRRLSKEEIPISLASLVLDPKVDLLVLGTARGRRFETAARSLTATLGYGARRVLRDLEVDAALWSGARRIWILGRPVDEIARLYRAQWPSDVFTQDARLAMGSVESRSSDAAVVVVMPHASGKDESESGAIGVIDALSPGALVEMGRYLAEHGEEHAQQSGMLWLEGEIAVLRNRGAIIEPLEVEVERVQ